MHIYFTI